MDESLQEDFEPSDDEMAKDLTGAFILPQVAPVQEKISPGLQILRAAFAEDPQCPDVESPQMAELIDKAKMPHNVIKFWFINEAKRRKKAETTARRATNGLLAATVPKEEKVRVRLANGTFSRAVSESSQNNKENVGQVYSHETTDQLHTLLLSFGKNTNVPCMDSDRMRRLTFRTGLSPRHIREWFLCQREKNIDKNATQQRKTPEQVTSSSPHLNTSSLKQENSRGTHDAKTPGQEQALLASFTKRRAFPVRGSRRCNRLMKRTGLDYQQIREWFREIRRREEENGGENCTEAEVSTLCGSPASVQQPVVGTSSGRYKTPEQVQALETAYSMNRNVPTLGSDRSMQLCACTGLSGRQIAAWFGHRRYRHGDPAPLPVHKTPEQIAMLSESFDADPSKPDGERLNELCQTTGLKAVSILCWFSDRKRQALFNSEQRIIQRNTRGTSLRRNEVIENKVELEERKGFGTFEEAETSRESIEKESVCGRSDNKQYKTPAQLQILHSSFRKDRHVPEPDSERLEKLCARTGLDAARIRTWFQRQPRVSKIRAPYASLREEQKQTEIPHEKTTVTAPLPETSDNSRFKTPEQLAALREALRKSRVVPEEGSERLESLCAATGLNFLQIRNWFHRQPNVKRKRGHAVRIEKTPEQCEMLETCYKESTSLPSGDRLTALKEASGLPESVIQNWFCHRRNSDRMKRCRSARGSKEKDESLNEEEKEERDRAMTRNMEESWLAEDSPPTEVHENSLDFEKPDTGAQLQKEKKQTFVRATKTPEQQEILLASYNKDRSLPVEERMAELKAKTGLATHAINNWFYGRWRKDRLQRPVESRRKERYVEDTEEREIEEHHGNQLPEEQEIQSAEVTTTTNENLCQAQTAEIPIDMEIDAMEYISGNNEVTEYPYAEVRVSDEPEHCVQTEEEKRREREKKEEERQRMEREKEEEQKRMEAERTVSLEPIVMDRDDVAEEAPTPAQAPVVAVVDDSDDEIEVIGEVNNLQVLFQGRSNRGGATKRKSSSIPTPPKIPRKCPICDLICSTESLSIVRLAEANSLDKFFGSSVSHFLTYTRGVRVCRAHITEHKIATDVIEL